MAKERVQIPPDVAAKVLFLSDRTCCVCRKEGKKVQIHHIDENPANNEEKNLAVLCFECHTDTMIKGGFHRKLDAEQIVLYRNDWLNIIARKRNLVEINNESGDDVTPVQVELATSIAEIYRENEEYELLAIHYDNIGNIELRDKYIEKVISNNPSDDSLLFLRGLQKRGKEVPREIVERHAAEHKKDNDWLGVARIYSGAEDPVNAVKYYLKGLSEVIEEQNYFTTAFYLKELVQDGLLESLFVRAYLEAKKKGELWWQIRALQELGWHTELEVLVKKNKTKILKLKDMLLLQVLAEVEGDNQKYISLIKQEAEAKHIFPDGTVGFIPKKKDKNNKTR